MPTEYFDSMEALIEKATNGVSFVNGASRSSRQHSDGWHGTRTWDEAIHLAKNGWPEGTAKIEKFTSMFTSMLGSKLQIDDYFYDVTGQDFDLSRVLAGEPEAWLNSEPIHVDAPAQHNVKIVVNVALSAAVDSKAVIIRGAAIAALVMLLEKARRRVEVEIVQRYSMSIGDNGAESSRNHAFTMLLKSAGQDLDLSKLAFCLAHASMCRRLGFAIIENGWPMIPSASYGYPCDMQKEAWQEGVIYCPKMFGTWTEATAQKWIEDNLKSQGIELKEGE